MTTTIHAELERKELLPDQHSVDMGYSDTQLLASSQRDYQIDLVGPARPDTQWQAAEKTGFDTNHFPSDWESTRQPAHRERPASVGLRRSTIRKTG